MMPDTLRWRQNGRDSVSNHQPHDCLLNRLFRRRSNKTSKLRVTGLCARNSPGTGDFPHKWPVTRKMFPFDDVIIILTNRDSGNDLLPVSHQAISRTISADILSNEQSKQDAVKFYLKCKHFHWQTFIYFIMSSAKWLSFPLGLGVSLTNNPTGIYKANTAFTDSWLCPGIALISQKTTIHQHNHSKSEGSISSITSDLICTVFLRFYW